MKFEDIVIKLNDDYPTLFIVYTNENSDNIVMRVYIKNSHFKKTEVINLTTIEKFIINTLLKTNIRGVENILSSTIDKVVRSYVKDDGSIGKKDILTISTVGTNMQDIMYNEYIDPYQTQSNSIIEIQKMFGIEAARTAVPC